MELSKRRTFWISLIIAAIALAAVVILAVTVGGAPLPGVVAVAVLIAVAALIGFVGRDEYRQARGTGLRRGPAVGRAIRKTVDAFVMSD